MWIIKSGAGHLLRMVKLTDDTYMPEMTSDPLEAKRFYDEQIVDSLIEELDRIGYDAYAVPVFVGRIESA